MNRANPDIRGILAVTGSSIVMFWPGAFIFGFPGVMGPYWQRVLHVGQGAIGNTLFFLLVAVGIFMFFVGRWEERVGTRKMIMVGTVLCSLAVVIVAYASTLFMIYLWAFLMGLGSCFVYIPALTVVQRWYPQRKGLVSGIVNSMFGLSAAIMSPVFAKMLETIGYFSMNLAAGALALVVGLVAAQFTECPNNARSERFPSEQSESLSVVSRGSLTAAESIRKRSFWFLWLTWTFQGAAGISMVTLSLVFGLSKGFTLEFAVAILTVFNIMNGSSRLVMGYLSDILGRRTTMSVAFFAGGVAYFLLPSVDSWGAVALLAGVVGLSYGTLFTVSAPLAADCFGMEHFGAILGLMFTGYGFFSGLIGPSMGGYLLDVSGGNFAVVFSYLGMFCVLSGVFVRWVVPALHK
jgi:OFA family oxalate/formate antiporter-like MFS transporter